MMADVCDKDLYDLKILEATDYIKSVSKKKPIKERILKYIAASNLKLQKEVVQKKAFSKIVEMIQTSVFI